MNPVGTSSSHLPAATVELIVRRWRLLATLIAAGLLLNLVLVRVLSGGLIPRPSAVSEPAWLLIAVLLVFTPWLTSSLRLMIWSRFFGRPLPFRSCARVVAGADFSAAATPTAVGGFPAKTALLAGEGFRPGDAVLVASLGGLEDGLFFAFAVPIALGVSGGFDMPYALKVLAGLERTAAPIGVVILAVLAIALIWRLGVRRRMLGASDELSASSGIGAASGSCFRNHVSRIAGDVRSHVKLEFSRTRDSVRYLLARGPSRLLMTLPMTCIGWSARYTAISAVLMAFGHHTDPVRLFALQWIVFTIMNLVPTPGASGGAEGSFVLVHRGIIPDPLTGAVVLCWRSLTFYLPAAVAGVAFVLLSRRRDAEHCGSERTTEHTSHSSRPVGGALDPAV